jgi:hypothetical protein
MLKKCLICGKEFNTIESRLKIGKGKYCSKKCYSISKKGVPTWNKGKTYKCPKIGEANSKRVVSEETRKKMSLFHTGLMVGEKNPMWKGGITYYPYSGKWTDTLRDSIRQRDDYTCQECGINQDELKGRLKQLDVHHIDYDKDNCNPLNLITLCRSCHTKTSINRDFWKNYFNKEDIC